MLQSARLRYCRPVNCGTPRESQPRRAEVNLKTESLFVGEDPDHSGPAPNLLVDPFQSIDGPDLLVSQSGKTIDREAFRDVLLDRATSPIEGSPWRTVRLPG